MSENKNDYSILEARLKTLLPEEYQDSYEDVRPVSMGSAGLKFDQDGRVAWDEIWGSFCHLAMAGGPPHRGMLLQPGTKAEIDQDRAGYRSVVAELCRGVEMVTGLAAMPSRFSGWIYVDCPSTSMAGWLCRAINMENVSAHVDGMMLHLPAGPAFRLGKEIKNVIVAIAKTCHYWVGHTSVAQHRAIAELFRVMDAESPLLQPPSPGSRVQTTRFERLREELEKEVQMKTGLQANGRTYYGWFGIDCLNVEAAVWMMRVAVACNMLCRREDRVLYLPVNPSTDPEGERVAATLAVVYRAARARGVV